VPADLDQISVRVNGVEVTVNWHYESATNSILFHVGHAPPPGAYIEVTYPLGC
jgi:hypothetical protein